MKRVLLWMAIGAGVLSLLFIVLQLLPPRGIVPGANPWRPTNGKPPLVIAHGGGQALQPPNTLLAFSNAVAIGCDIIEFDLRLTKDDVLVTLHDATIDRTSDRSGRAIDFTLAELKAMNFGFKFKDTSGRQPHRESAASIATVEELFRAYPKMPMVIELKDRLADGARAAKQLASLIEKYQMAPRVIVAAFDDATLDEFRRASQSRVSTATAMGRTRAFVFLNKSALDWFAPTGDVALQIPVEKSGHRLDTPSLIRAAHRRNMAVHYWTINDPAEMRRLIALGADGLMTDRPDLLRSVIAEHVK